MTDKELKKYLDQKFNDVELVIVGMSCFVITHFFSNFYLKIIIWGLGFYCCSLNCFRSRKK